MDRRTFLSVSGGLGLALGATRAGAAGDPAPKYQQQQSPWPLCLNTSTIRPASLEDKVRVAAETGYDAIEPWMKELREYEAAGGNLADLGQSIRDQGLFVANVIGLWSCMPATQEAFDASLEQTREHMRLAAAVGSPYAAAIPTPDRADFDLQWGAACYRRLLEIGRSEFNIIPAIEFVGFLKGVHRLGQAAAIAIDADHPDACIVADTFHLFRGGSGFGGAKLLGGKAFANFHWNDVPGDVPREEQGDAHRIYPGDGILPLKPLLSDLRAIGYTGPLSLELFNPEHYKQDPKVVAETGKRKMLEGIAGAA